jgi:hypothetical protein
MGSTRIARRAGTYQAHGAKGILTAHPLLHLFLGRHLQEAAQFFVQFLADFRLSEH